MHRRALAALAVVLGATACSVAVAQDSRPNAAGPRSRALVQTAPSPSATPAEAATSRRPAAQPAGYRVSSTESFPAAKRVAEHAALARLGGTVVYAQMGGATADAASVLVVVRQPVTRADGSTTTVTRTVDVRLTKSGTGWAFDRIASDGGTPVQRPSNLSVLAASVVDNPRIWMPDTAKWDIYRGSISPVLLQLLDRIAQHHSIAITVLESGHPLDVFGTSHRSMHSFGRAADINMIDGTHVIDERSAGSPADSLVHWLMRQSVVGQVGSPWDLDGSASARSFTNSVHLDHVHVSV